MTRATVSAPRLQTLFAGDFITAHKPQPQCHRPLAELNLCVLVHFHLLKYLLGQMTVLMGNGAMFVIHIGPGAGSNFLSISDVVLRLRLELGLS